MYAWDPKKDLENRKKHGLRFETAAQIFEGPILTRLDDREDYGEERWISLGQVATMTVILVAHTDRQTWQNAYYFSPKSNAQRKGDLL